MVLKLVSRIVEIYWYWYWLLNFCYRDNPTSQYINLFDKASELLLFSLLLIYKYKFCVVAVLLFLLTLSTSSDTTDHYSLLHLLKTKN